MIQLTNKATVIISFSILSAALLIMNYCGKGKEIEEEKKREIPPHERRETVKAERREKKKALLAMKKPMYDNIKMMDYKDASKHLCNISRKKAKWYVSKNLAKWLEKETTIQLLFEPNYRNKKEREDDKNYIRSKKQNQCVTCGESEYLIRHYIVPHSYRTLLPLHNKAHLSHDIVPLCHNCHLDATQYTQQRMSFFEDNLRMELTDRENIKFFYDSRARRISKVSQALLKFKHKLPVETVTEYRELICDYLSISQHELTTSTLAEATMIDYRHPNPDYIPGPELVIHSLEDNEERLAQFIIEWRRFFISTMKPQFLPEGWSCNYTVECGRKN